jgi:hypothetical protein
MRWEGVVDADFAGVLKHEEFGGKRVAGEVADAVQIEAEAVDGFHAKSGVVAVVIGLDGFAAPTAGCACRQPDVRAGSRGGKRQFSRQWGQ